MLCGQCQQFLDTPTHAAASRSDIATAAAAAAAVPGSAASRRGAARRGAARRTARQLIVDELRAVTADQL